jgi:hypothetical protein
LLFLDAADGQQAVATDTISAMLQIAQNPARNVNAIYELNPASGAAFTPTLTAAPATWALSLISLVPAPVFSPAPGTYTTAQSVTLTETLPGTTIYFTTDGSVPSSSSARYSGEIPVSASTTLRAIAIFAGLSSSVVSGAYTITPMPSLTMAPAAVTLFANESEAFSTKVVAADSGDVKALSTTPSSVAWTISPSVGTISSTGVYTAPSRIASVETVTVMAANASASAAAQVTLEPVSVSVSPATDSLLPSQAAAFSASVTNTTNTAVTWSISPALGTITTGGHYVAPSTITSPAIVTVTATSVADPTESASAVVALTPAETVTMTPAAVTLLGSQSQVFTATVENSTNTALTWSISPAIGTISAEGVYTAPSTITATEAVTVTATSVANTAKYAKSTVTLAPPVSVAITPLSPTLVQTQGEAFYATVTD